MCIRDRAVAGETWLDFTRADKGTGLAALCGELGVRPQEVIAFGDNFNDVPMSVSYTHLDVYKRQRCMRT